jgi:hypothetical protein
MWERLVIPRRFLPSGSPTKVMYAFLIPLMGVTCLANLIILIMFTEQGVLQTMSRDSAVGMATGYGLDYRGVGVRVPVGARIFSSPRRPDRLWGPPSLLSNRYWQLFPRGKSAGAWNWSLRSSYNRGQENVDLYIHAPIRLHGVVLN